MAKKDEGKTLKLNFSAQPYRISKGSKGNYSCSGLPSFAPDCGTQGYTGHTGYA